MGMDSTTDGAGRDLTFDAEVKRLKPLFSGATGKTSFPDPQTLYWRLPEQYFRGDTLLGVLRNLFRRGAGESAPEATSEPQAPTRGPRDPAQPPTRSSGEMGSRRVAKAQRARQ